MDKLIQYSDVEICQREQVVLKQVSFEVNEAEFVYLVGKVGSGKSSLLKTLYAELAVENGEARIFEYDLRHIKRRQIPYLRRQIGIIFQDFQLLTDRSVYDNLCFVLKATGWNKDDIDQRVNEVLNEVDMAKKGYKMPHELSGGEQQRIVIARALLNRPKLILADEPTGNLDYETGRQIVELLHRVASENGSAVIMCTHNNAWLNEFPARVFSIQGNRLVETNHGTTLSE
ncbi:MAG: ATP-binding cassette domain-containing protein [Paludibacteraceae bacterium]|nr:ATP-binding cassette domain-containing protein [Paludibacteraceae bacterium]